MFLCNIKKQNILNDFSQNRYEETCSEKFLFPCWLLKFSFSGTLLISVSYKTQGLDVSYQFTKLP